jgi:hypothetical protein
MESEPHDLVAPDPGEEGPDADLSAALDALSDQDREILRLWAWEQLEPREIKMPPHRVRFCARSWKNCNPNSTLWARCAVWA